MDSTEIQSHWKAIRKDFLRHLYGGSERALVCSLLRFEVLSVQPYTSSRQNILVVETTSIAEEPVTRYRVLMQNPCVASVECFAAGVEAMIYPPDASQKVFGTMDEVYQFLIQDGTIGPNEQLRSMDQPSLLLRLILDGNSDDEEALYVDFHRFHPQAKGFSISGQGVMGHMSEETLTAIMLAMNARDDILDFGPDDAGAYIHWNGALRKFLGEHCCLQLGIPLIPLEDPRGGGNDGDEVGSPSLQPKRQRSLSDSAIVPRTCSPPPLQQEFHTMADFESGECAL